MKHLALGFLLLALGCTTVSVPFPPEMYDDSTPTLDAGLSSDDGNDTADADESPSDEDAVDAGPSADDNAPADAGADADGSEAPEDGN